MGFTQWESRHGCWDSHTAFKVQPFQLEKSQQAGALSPIHPKYDSPWHYVSHADADLHDICSNSPTMPATVSFFSPPKKVCLMMKAKTKMLEGADLWSFMSHVFLKQDLHFSDPQRKVTEWQRPTTDLQRDSCFTLFVKQVVQNWMKCNL